MQSDRGVDALVIYVCSKAIRVQQGKHTSACVYPLSVGMRVPTLYMYSHVIPLEQLVCFQQYATAGCPALCRCTHIQVYVDTHTHAYTYIRTHAHTHTHTDVDTYVCTYMYVRMNIFVNIV